LAHAHAQRLGVEVHRQHEQVLGLLRLAPCTRRRKPSPVVERERDVLADRALADALHGRHDVLALEVDAVIAEGLRELRVEGALGGVVADRRHLLQPQVLQARAQAVVLDAQLVLARGGARVLLRLGHELARALEQRRVRVAGLGQRQRASRDGQRLDRLAGLAQLDRFAVRGVDQLARALGALRALHLALRTLVVDPPGARADEQERRHDGAAQRDGQLAAATLLRRLDARFRGATSAF
jgi:hypothetical protein